MSILRNLLNAFVPVRERRETFGILGGLNAELVLDINGDESALVDARGGAGSFNGTLEFSASADGTNYLPILVLPYFGSGSGAVPNPAQPLITDSPTNVTNAVRVYAMRTAQLKKLRVRLSAWTAGALDVSIISDAQKSLHPSIFEGRPTSLFVTATAAAGAAVTATLPVVTGMRHYIDFIKVTRSATAALTASATPLLVTTTNLPGSPVLTFGADAGGIGVDVERGLDFGGTGLSASVAATASTIVAPATPSVIWRINVGYRLGL